MNSWVISSRQEVQEEASVAEAYLSVLPELAAFPAERLRVLNIDVISVVAAALGALPRILAEREGLATLPGFDLARFDKLELYARALTHAHGCFQVASEPENGLKALQAEARQLRELLFQDASVAVARRLLPPDSLDALRGSNGYRNTANDLQILALLLTQHWDTLEGRVGTTREELAYAEKLGFHLLRAIGLRKMATRATAVVSEMRVRAFSLFVSTYEEARLAIGYLRRNEGDADLIAPSLYLYRKKSRKVDAASNLTFMAMPLVDATPATYSTSAEPTMVPTRRPSESLDPNDPFGSNVPLVSRGAGLWRRARSLATLPHRLEAHSRHAYGGGVVTSGAEATPLQLSSTRPKKVFELLL